MTIKHLKKFKKYQKKYYYGILFLLLMTFAILFSVGQISDVERNILSNKESTETSADLDEVKLDQSKDKTEVAIPAEAELQIPFASQAPLGDWSEPYENACEEASIIMVRHFLNRTSLSKDQMKQEIDELIAWQIANFGSHADLTANETLKMAKSFYSDLDGEVINEINVETIKSKIATGLPVIVPADGKKLNNPNFKNGGPNYHMLVVKGYNNDQFITNDPGTRKGNGYIYDFKTLISSVKNPAGGRLELLVLKRK